MKGKLNIDNMPLKENNALLIATTPLNATVNLSRNNINLLPIIWIDIENNIQSNLFSISPNLFDEENNWTITSILNSNSEVREILINTNNIYEISLVTSTPIEYQPVKYISFPSGSRIDTGLYSNNGSYAAHFKVNDITYVNDKHYIGTAGASTYFHFTTYSNKYYWCSGSTEQNAGAWAPGIYEVIYNDINFNFIPQLNGVALSTSTTEARKYTGNILLGSRSGKTNFTGYYYWCILKNNNTQQIEKNLIPCYRKSDNVIGMWESVSQTFLINAGSGTFTIGEII